MSHDLVLAGGRVVRAEVLQGMVRAMRPKGRVQTGADADLVVFDEALCPTGVVRIVHAPVVRYRPFARRRDVRRA